MNACTITGCSRPAGPTGRCERVHNAQWPPAQHHGDRGQADNGTRPEIRHRDTWSDVAAVKAGRVDPPETLRQAQRHDQAVERYVGAGLCRPCASQAAWAGQIGYARVRPPCSSCAVIVHTFPGAGHVNGWRSIPEMSRDHPRAPISTGSGARGTGTAPDAHPVGIDALNVAA